MTTIRRPKPIERNVIRLHAALVLLMISTGLNVLQHRRGEVTLRPAEHLPPPGTRLPAIDVMTADGRPLRVSYDSQTLPTILYYFSPDCGWCERNWGGVVALEKATRGKYRFIAVTTAHDSERQDQMKRWSVPTFWSWPEAQRAIHQFAGTPHTVAVSHDGHVLRSWPGAYIRRVKLDLEQYFHVRLPELTPPIVR